MKTRLKGKSWCNETQCLQNGLLQRRGNECRKSLSSPLMQSNGVRSHFMAVKTLYIFYIYILFFLGVFSVSYLRGKRVTTLSNRRETGVRFTTHGTLFEGDCQVALGSASASCCGLQGNSGYINYPWLIHKLGSKSFKKKKKIIGPQQRNMCLRVCQ